MADLIIKKGAMELVKTDKANLIEANQTYDGMVFNFKGGITITYTDNYFPVPAKDLIVNTLNSFANANIVVDLANYNRPVTASV